MKEFHYRSSSRKIVIHQCYKFIDDCSFCRYGDILFFDDCLYSQYAYLLHNIEMLKSMNALCVIGLSPKLVRDPNMQGALEIDSIDIHRACNKIIHSALDDQYCDEMNGLMTLDEVRELLRHDNVYLALHGCCHLDLRRVDGVMSKCKAFIEDVKNGIQMLQMHNLESDIFVYPYAFSLQMFDQFLQLMHFKHIFAGEKSKRLKIEELI